MANKDYIAAEAIKLYIGDLEFDAIKTLSTKEYRMSQLQVLTSAGEHKNWLTRLQFSAPDMYKTLISKGFDPVTVPVQYTVIGKNNRTASVRAESLSLSNVRILWRFLDKQYNKPQAESLVDALSEDSLRDRFEQVYGESRRTAEERRQHDRISMSPCPYNPLYEKAICSKGFIWFGSNFYWRYFYFWMTPEEKAKHERLNPIKDGKRQSYIHQMLETATRERLRTKAIELGTLIKMSRNRDDFENNFRKTYGNGWQLELF